MPLARSLYASLHSFRGCLLRRSLRKDGGAVLRPDVVALTIQCRGIVQLEEPFLEQILITECRRVERDPYRFGVARLAVVCVMVGRILQPASGVAHIGVDDAGHVAEDV